MNASKDSMTAWTHLPAKWAWKRQILLQLTACTNIITTRVPMTWLEFAFSRWKSSFSAKSWSASTVRLLHPLIQGISTSGRTRISCWRMIHTARVSRRVPPGLLALVWRPRCAGTTTMCVSWSCRAALPTLDGLRCPSSSTGESRNCRRSRAASLSRKSREE